MAVEFIKARQMQAYLHLFKHAHTHYLQTLRLCTCVCCQAQTGADIKNTGPMQQDYG